MGDTQIQWTMPYLSDNQLEQRANLLLQQWALEDKPVTEPPVPVSLIAEIVLRLRIDWDEIADSDEAPILGFLNAPKRKIHINDRRRAHFAQYPGSEEYTLAHEVGHWVLHVVQSNGTQHSFLSVNDWLRETAMYGSVSPRPYQSKDERRRELQANRFASYLLLPRSLILPAISGLDLCTWSTLYTLRDRFNVSISALCNRLEGMGLIAIEGKTIYPSRAQRDGQLSLF